MLPDVDHPMSPDTSQQDEQLEQPQQDEQEQQEQQDEQETQLQQLQLELQESLEAQELLREKITAAATIIKRQKVEFSQLMDSMADVPQDVVDSLKSNLQGEIPCRLDVNALNLLSQLLEKLGGAQNQINEMNHYLKVSSDGFDYERQVLEKENQTLAKEKMYLQDEIDKKLVDLNQVKTKIGERLQLELKEKQQLQIEMNNLKMKIKESESKIVDLESTKIDQDQIEKSEKMTDKLKNEIERLTSHLIEVESSHQQDIMGLEAVVASLKAEISEANREQKTWEESIDAEKVNRKEIETSLSLAQEELKRLNQENEKLRIKSKEDLKCIDNLQMVLNDFQSGI
jgi:chromosome segregation ATPase